MREAFLKTRHHHWFRLSLLYFIIAALLGLLMRYAQIGGLPDWLVFTNIRHAHSHLALLGWLYSGLYILIVSLYKLDRKVYTKLYWLSQLSVFGMLVSFPIQGYKQFSIAFLAIFILLSFLFVFWVLKDLRTREKDASTIFLKTALFFLVLSSVGTWSLPFMMNSALKGSAMYYGAIQFYLHFQFNGWLIFGILAILIRLLVLFDIQLNEQKLFRFYLLLLLSTFLTFALAVTWSTPLPSIFWINSLGVLIQAIALVAFFKFARSFLKPLKASVRRTSLRLLYISFFSFVLKIIIQTCVVVPYIATVSYTIRNFVIGFIHLLMLGCISLFLIAIFQHFSLTNKGIRIGLTIFTLGIVISELLLFLQGILLWGGLGFMHYYHELLFAISILMPLGLTLYFISFKIPSKTG